MRRYTAIILEPRPDWSPLGVNFKILDEHPHPFLYSSSPPPRGAKHGICLLVWLLPNYMASRIVLPAGALGRMENTLIICRLCPVSSLPREFHITRDRKSATGMKSRGLNCFRRPKSIVFNLEQICDAMLSFISIGREL